MIYPIRFKFPDKDTLFSSDQWEKIKRKIEEYERKLFSESSSKWEFNKFLNKLVEHSLSVENFKQIAKFEKWYLDINEISNLNDEEKIEFVTHGIKKRINRVLKFLYKEIVKELVINGKRKNGLLKFEFKNNKSEDEKEFYWWFFYFLIENWLKNISDSESELKKTMKNYGSKKFKEHFLSNNELTNFWKYEDWILMYSSKFWHKLNPELYHLLHESKNSRKNPFHILKMFTCIEDLYLGSKDAQNEEYDFSKIDFIFFYKKAFQINRLPIEIAVDSNSSYEILFTIRGEWWIKLILENILLFTLQNN